MKGKTLAIIGGAIVTVAVITAVILLTGEESYRTIAVEALKGVTIVTNEKTESKEAYEGMHLYSGDDVEVQNDSNMTMVLDMDKYVYAEPGTHFWLECAGSQEQSETIINLAEGSILNRLKNNLNEGEVYKVDTPNSTMAVRGTVFRVTVYRDRDGLIYTRVEVYDGQVQIDLKTEEGEYNGITEIFEAGEAALIRGNVEFSEFVIGEGKNIKLPIAYKELPKDVAQMLVQYIEDQEELCIEKELLEDYTSLEEHKMEKRAGKDATCTEDGYEEVWCTVCNEVSETIVIPATGHVADGWTTDKEATCEVAGHRQRVCNTCGTVFEEEEVPALNHVPGEAQVVNAVTCVLPGVWESYCERCGIMIEHIEAPAPGHSIGEWQTVNEPTCTLSGTKAKKCELCGEFMETDEVPAKGHSMGSWVRVKSPSATSDGEERRTCIICGKSESKTIPAYGEKTKSSDKDDDDDDDSTTDTSCRNHIGDWEEETSATCTTDGVEVRVCEVCGTRESREIPATGHDIINGTRLEPSCTEDGEVNGTCNICGESVTEVIPATGHEERVIHGYRLEQGEAEVRELLTHSVECGNCGDIIEEQQDTDVSGIPMSDAGYSCDYCDYVGPGVE